jgi:hypothetical protein
VEKLRTTHDAVVAKGQSLKAYLADYFRTCSSPGQPLNLDWSQHPDQDVRTAFQSLNAWTPDDGDDLLDSRLFQLGSAARKAFDANENEIRKIKGAFERAVSQSGGSEERGLSEPSPIGVTLPLGISLGAKAVVQLRFGFSAEQLKKFGELTLSQQREILGFIPVWCEKALKSGDGVAAVHEVFDYTVKKYLEAAK